MMQKNGEGVEMECEDYFRYCCIFRKKGVSIET